MKDNHHIDFLLLSHVQGMHFQPGRPEGIEFTPDDNGALRFVLRPKKSGHDDYGTSSELECKVCATYSATEDQALFVDSYNNQKVMLRVADEITLPFKWKDTTRIAEDGSFEGYYPPRSLCPQDTSQLIEKVELDLISKTDRFLTLLRWRQGIDAPGEVVRYRTLYWKAGEGRHLLAPPPGDPIKITEIQGMCGIHWDDEHQSDLQELWSSPDLIEPLGHVLVREAAALASESPRSSILIVTAALETGVKMHISNIAPDTAWLMENIPSPPVFKILRDYIPQIHRDRGKDMDFWDKVKPLIKKTQDLIEVRNKVAHTGIIPQDAGSIQDYLELVSDLLYLLDVLDGQEWAKTLIGYKLRQELDWPSDQKIQRFTIVSEQG